MQRSAHSTPGKAVCLGSAGTLAAAMHRYRGLWYMRGLQWRTQLHTHCICCMCAPLPGELGEWTLPEQHMARLLPQENLHINNPIVHLQGIHQASGSPGSAVAAPRYHNCCGPAITCGSSPRVHAEAAHNSATLEAAHGTAWASQCASATKRTTAPLLAAPDRPYYSVSGCAAATQRAMAGPSRSCGKDSTTQRAACSSVSFCACATPRRVRHVLCLAHDVTAEEDHKCVESVPNGLQDGLEQALLAIVCLHEKPYLRTLMDAGTAAGAGESASDTRSSHVSNPAAHTCG